MTFLRTSKRYKMTGYFSCYLIPFGGEAERMFTIGHRVHWIYKPAGKYAKGDIMATSVLEIKNGKIVNHSDRYFHSLSEDGKEYSGNGWNVTIKEGRNGRPGRIICHAERNYSYGPAVCHREFRLEDGTLGLAGGNITSRYAYFRSADFTGWLKENGIQAVRRQNPNTTYRSCNPVSDVWSHDLIIDTDGKAEHSEDLKSITISGATYAKVAQRYCDGIGWHTRPAILYTEVRDVKSLF